MVATNSTSTRSNSQSEVPSFFIRRIDALKRLALMLTWGIAIGAGTYLVYLTVPRCCVISTKTNQPI